MVFEIYLGYLNGFEPARTTFRILVKNSAQNAAPPVGLYVYKNRLFHVCSIYIYVIYLN